MSYAPRFMPKPRFRAAVSFVISVGCVVAGAACSVAVQGEISVGPRGDDASIPPAPTGEPSTEPSSPADAAPPPPKDAATPDAAPKGAYATVGRWDVRDPLGPRAGWPGSTVRFRFVGTEAGVSFKETPGRGGPSEWDVAIDGVWQQQKLVLARGISTYTVAKGLAAKEHTVEVLRRNEGLEGSTQLLGVTVPGGTLLPAPPRRALTFEFLGDSYTNGYGIEGTSARCPYSASTQNFHLTFASRVADAFGADAVAIAYQGKGLTKNYARGTTPLFPELYGRALPDDPTSLWDARFAPVDAVFVMLGANDYLQERATVFDPPSFADFRDAYAALLRRARQSSPLAHVFAIVSPTQTDLAPAAYFARTNQVNAVSEAVAAQVSAGDAKVHFLDVPTEPQTELSACDYHPSVGVHERLANAIVPEVRRLAGF